MPVESLLDDPRVIALPVAGFGALWRIAIHYWLTECRPLPAKDSDLRFIARTHRPTWAIYSAEITGILSDYLPKLETAWRARRNRLDNLSKLGALGAGIVQVRALERKAAKAARQAASVDPIQPRRDSRLTRAPDKAPSGNGGGFIE